MTILIWKCFNIFSGMALQGYWDVTGVWVGGTQHIWAWSDGEPWWDEIKWGSGGYMY